MAKTEQKKAIILPVEIRYCPTLGGTYNLHGAYSNKSDEKIGVCRFDFVPGGGSEETDAADPWEMREEFLWPETRWEGMTLGWGRFGIGDADISVQSRKLRSRFCAGDAHTLLDEEFLEWQSLVQAAMTTKMAHWPKLKATYPAYKVDLLCRPMAVAIEWQQSWPTGVVDCTGVLQALIATLHIDALMDVEHRHCACRGCREIFKVVRKDHRYCSEDCRHKQVIREIRDRQRKAAEQNKTAEHHQGGK
jgi:hypothetical protein